MLLIVVMFVSNPFPYEAVVQRRIRSMNIDQYQQCRRRELLSDGLARFLDELLWRALKHALHLFFSD